MGVCSHFDFDLELRCVEWQTLLSRGRFRVVPFHDVRGAAWSPRWTNLCVKRAVRKKSMMSVKRSFGHHKGGTRHCPPRTSGWSVSSICFENGILVCGKQMNCSSRGCRGSEGPFHSEETRKEVNRNLWPQSSSSRLFCNNPQKVRMEG